MPVRWLQTKIEDVTFFAKKKNTNECCKRYDDQRARKGKLKINKR